MKFSLVRSLHRAAPIMSDKSMINIRFVHVCVCVCVRFFYTLFISPLWILKEIIVVCRTQCNRITFSGNQTGTNNALRYKRKKKRTPFRVSLAPARSIAARVRRKGVNFRAKTCVEQIIQDRPSRGEFRPTSVVQRFNSEEQGLRRRVFAVNATRSGLLI